MFGFGKKKNQEKGKKKSKLDKLIMGAIVGGAVGSVIGMSIAPHKGKETRDIIAQKGKEIIKKGQESLEKLTDAAGHGHASETADEVIQEAKHQKKKLLAKIADRIFGRSKKVKKDLLKDKDFKKIPNEVE